MQASLGPRINQLLNLKKGIQRDVRSYSCKHITKTDKHEKGYSMVLKSKDRAAMTLMSVIISAATFDFSTLNCGIFEGYFCTVCMAVLVLISNIPDTTTEHKLQLCFYTPL